MSWTIPKLAEHSRFENGWTEEVTKVVGSDENKEQSHREPGQEVNKVVAMGLHEGTNEPDVCC